MKIEYKLKQEDYKNALIELLRRKFWKRIIRCNGQKLG